MPELRVAIVGLRRTPDVELGAGGGAMAAVEALQRPRHGVAEPREALGRDPLAGGRVAEACALERQELEFLGAIEDAQVAIELEAVDDRRRIVEEDVLGPQVAVRLDDAAARRARIEPARVRGDKCALRLAERYGSSVRSSVASTRSLAATWVRRRAASAAPSVTAGRSAA